MASVAPAVSVSHGSLRGLGAFDQPLPRLPSDRVVAVQVPPPATVMLTRPLLELASHISNRICPSWQLIARCIKVIVLAFFRGHFCDYVILVTGVRSELRTEELSPNWRDNTSVQYSFIGPSVESSVRVFEHHFPFMFKRAIELGLRHDTPLYPTVDRIVEQNPGQPVGLVRLPPIDTYPAIDAQTVRERYFQNFLGVTVTDREEGNTIRDLLQSRHFQRLSD